MEALEAIAELDGFDMLFVVFLEPAEFSQSIGRPGNGIIGDDNRARKQVAAVARKYGKKFARYQWGSR